MTDQLSVHVFQFDIYGVAAGIFFVCQIADINIHVHRNIAVFVCAVCKACLYKEITKLCTAVFGIQINVTHDTAQLNEILIFQITSDAPAIYFQCDRILSILVQIRCDIEIMRRKAVCCITNLFSVDEQIISRSYGLQ